MEWLAFVLCIMGLLSSIFVISAKNSVHSVFFLILTFCISSCVLIYLTIDFLAIIFIVVYVGAIAVLFLFVVMMLNIRLAHVSESFVRYILLSFLLGIIFLIELIYFLLEDTYLFVNNVKSEWIFLLDRFSGIKLISELIYTHYFYSFIISGMVLLVAMIGTISLTLYHSLNVRRQAVYRQVGRSEIDSIMFFSYYV